MSMVDPDPQKNQNKGKDRKDNPVREGVNDAAKDVGKRNNQGNKTGQNRENDDD